MFSDRCGKLPLLFEEKGTVEEVYDKYIENPNHTTHVIGVVLYSISYCAIGIPLEGNEKQSFSETVKDSYDAMKATYPVTLEEKSYIHHFEYLPISLCKNKEDILVMNEVIDTRPKP